MFILRFLWAVLTSRWLWTLIGITLLSLVIWVFGPIVKVGAYEPFASENVRIVIIALLVIFWLIWLIVAQRRAIRANHMFAEVMAELKRRRLGGRKFLREMPWYVIVGPPATGKTTALRQSGLNFPIDLTDDLQGVGGTRNCDWFFSENAVLIDTAGRYVQQES
ncbi:MAG: type VI secretion system membrane subunit TssM, partial [Mesorhizobium sp.]